MSDVPLVRRGLYRAALILALGLLPLPAPAPAAAQSLTDALATAYSSNPRLLSARAALRAVNEGVPQALSNWRPRVSVTGSVGEQRLDANGLQEAERTTPVVGQLQVTQPLYRGGRTVADTKRAEAEVTAQRARLISTEQVVLLDAAIAYMDVWRDQAVLQLTINNEQVLGRQLEASQDRFTVGEITRTDVAQSESRLSRASATRIESEGLLTTSRARYREVVGTTPGVLQAVPPLEKMPESLEAVLAVAREDNPSIVSSRFSAIAAGYNVRQLFGLFLPEVVLSGSLSRSENTFTDESETDTARIEALVSVPLYQQGLVSSQVRQAKQVQNQRRIEIDTARRNTEQLAVSGWETLITTRAQISAIQDEVKAAEIALEGVRQENAVGARTVLDVLDAEQELFEAQVRLVRAQRDEVVAAFQVLTAMGRMTAAYLELPVAIYDPQVDYQAVRDRWYGIAIPGE